MATKIALLILVLFFIFYFASFVSKLVAGRPGEHQAPYLNHYQR